MQDLFCGIKFYHITWGYECYFYFTDEYGTHVICLAWGKWTKQWHWESSLSSVHSSFYYLFREVSCALTRQRAKQCYPAVKHRPTNKETQLLLKEYKTKIPQLYSSFLTAITIPAVWLDCMRGSGSVTDQPHALSHLSLHGSSIMWLLSQHILELWALC